MNEWMSEWVIMEFNVAAGIFHPFATKWMNEWMNEWIGEGIYEWMNNWLMNNDDNMNKWIINE